MFSIFFKRFSRRYFAASTLITKRFSTNGEELAAYSSSFSLYIPPLSQLQAFIHISKHICMGQRRQIALFIGCNSTAFGMLFELRSLGMSMTLPRLVNHLVLHTQPLENNLIEYQVEHEQQCGTFYSQHPCQRQLLLSKL